VRVLIAAALLTATAFPVHAEERQEYVRVTYYHLRGRMYDGEPVHRGAAACSSGQPGSGSLAFPTGTILQLSDGLQFTCEDTGYGDYYWKAWIDIWTPSGGLGYQEYEWVTVIRWGWDD